MALLNSSDAERLTKEKNLWLSTVSSESIPHIVPIWFVLHESKLYICTGKHSIKAKHIRNNPNIAFALEHGINPVSGIGKCIIKDIKTINSSIITKFKEKYDWDITTDKDYTLLIEIEIEKMLLRKK